MVEVKLDEITSQFGNDTVIKATAVSTEGSTAINNVKVPLQLQMVVGCGFRVNEDGSVDLSAIAANTKTGLLFIGKGR